MIITVITMAVNELVNDFRPRARSSRFHANPLFELVDMVLFSFSSWYLSDIDSIDLPDLGMHGLYIEKLTAMTSLKSRDYRSVRHH